MIHHNTNTTYVNYSLYLPNKLNMLYVVNLGDKKF